MKNVYYFPTERKIYIELISPTNRTSAKRVLSSQNILRIFENDVIRGSVETTLTLYSIIAPFDAFEISPI